MRVLLQRSPLSGSWGFRRRVCCVCMFFSSRTSCIQYRMLLRWRWSSRYGGSRRLRTFSLCRALLSVRTAMIMVARIWQLGLDGRRCCSASYWGLRSRWSARGSVLRYFYTERKPIKHKAVYNLLTTTETFATLGG